MILLGAPVFAYIKHRNASVPAGEQFSLSDTIRLRERLEQRRQAKASRTAALQFLGPKGEARAVPPKEDPLYPIHIMAEDLIGPALDGRASRLDLHLSQQRCLIQQMVDGVRYKREPLEGDAGAKVFAYLKDLAGQNIQEQRKKQSGTFSVRTSQGGGGPRVLTLTTGASSTGQVMRIDIDRAKQLSKPFDSLGLLPAQLEALRSLQLPEHLHGVVLVGAPTGHGLTTTAYSLLSRHDAYTSNIKTLEVEVMHRLDGVDHVQYDAKNQEVDYGTHLQSILRRDPDIVLAMDIRDHEAARIAAEPGMDGPLIYVPVPSATIVDLVRTWVKLVGDVKKATRGLRAVTNQRLVRTLCPNCKQAYAPTPEQLKKLNIPSGRVQQFFRESGKVQVKNKIENCPVCNGIGYLGQTAAFEVMMVDDEARKILSTGDLKAALAHARRNKMMYLQEAALAKVISGETSIQEVIRVTAPAEAAKAEQGEPSAAA
jgi:general secretion pathway protein E